MSETKRYVIICSKLGAAYTFAQQLGLDQQENEQIWTFKAT
jgi:hypothetical protein